MLVVDDNRTNRLILTEKLRAWELQAVAASSAEEALEKLGGPEPVDVCVIDFKMPRMNGIELARRIRRAGAPHAPSLILFTSVSLVDPDFRTLAATVGMPTAFPSCWWTTTPSTVRWRRRF